MVLKNVFLRERENCEYNVFQQALLIYNLYNLLNKTMLFPAIQGRG